MKALICGISGQDGSYLAKLLLSKGYEVSGTSRDAHMSRFHNLEMLGIKEDIRLHSMAVNDFRSVLQTISDVAPDEIYYLAGQSSVALSFEQPMETMESISSGILNIMEAIRFFSPKIKLFNASSSECFGNTGGIPADESTPFRPRSPYAVAKSAAHWEVANYREAYDLFASNGILFNHESILRPTRFVTKKICSSVKQISEGKLQKLVLGNLDIERDWGWAPEYVEAMWKILQYERPEDFVIATGKSSSLRHLVDLAFDMVGLNSNDYVEIDRKLSRPSDLSQSTANPKKINDELGWKANLDLQEIVRKLMENEII